VAFFHKQHGGPTPKAAGRALDGLVWHQYPDGTGFAHPAEAEAGGTRPSPASGQGGVASPNDAGPEVRRR
jgi:hypothetical protein